MWPLVGVLEANRDDACFHAGLTCPVEGTARLIKQAAADSDHSMDESPEPELRRRREYDADPDDGRLLHVE